MAALLPVILALAAGGTTPAARKCDLTRDAIAWGDANIYLKRYPGPDRATLLFVTMSVSRYKGITGLSFSQRLRYADKNRSKAIVDLMVERNGHATSSDGVEDFVMMAYDVRRIPRSVTLLCGKDVLSRTSNLTYGD